MERDLKASINALFGYSSKFNLNLEEYITLLSVGKPRRSAICQCFHAEYITLLSVGKPRLIHVSTDASGKYITLLSVGKPRLVSLYI